MERVKRWLADYWIVLAWLFVFVWLKYWLGLLALVCFVTTIEIYVKRKKRALERAFSTAKKEIEDMAKALLSLLEGEKR